MCPGRGTFGGRDGRKESINEAGFDQTAQAGLA
jgi:hypothetical protein